jgi:gamma-glutamyltranspeptidase
LRDAIQWVNRVSHDPGCCCIGAEGGTSIDQWTLSSIVPLNRYGLSGQNATFSASWITRGFTAVLLIAPNVGEAKLTECLNRLQGDS